MTRAVSAVTPFDPERAMQLTIRNLLRTTMPLVAVLTVAGAAYAFETEAPDINELGQYTVSFGDGVAPFRTATYTLRYNVTAEFMCATADPQPLTLPQFTRTISNSGSVSLPVTADLNG